MYRRSRTSGEFVAYNSSGHPAAISSDEPFDFVGGYFGVAWLQSVLQRRRFGVG